MCNTADPFVTYLKTVGYNAIRLPRSNIKPLQILAKTGRDLEWLGDLSDVFVPHGQATLPAIEADVVAAAINGRRTGDLSIGLGISLLGSVIGALGGSKLGLTVAYKQARTAVFEFNDVQSDLVALVKLDQYLGESDINPASVHVGKLLESDQIYVITNTIKSRKFTVEAKSSSGTSVEVEVPVIQEAVGGEIKVSGNGERATKVTYEGAVPLIFGFQAVQLYFENGAYTAFKPLAAGSVAARALADVPDDGASRLMTEGPFVGVKWE